MNSPHVPVLKFSLKKSGDQFLPLYRIVIALSIVVLNAHCMSKPEEMISPTTGHITILADESLKEIVEQEKEVFESTYKYAKLLIRYDSEYHNFNAFFEDSADVLFATRGLTSQESEFFRLKKIFPRQVHFASGALAFVVAKDSRDTAFTYENFTGLMKDSTQGKRFVIENNQSGIANQIMQITGTQRLPAHFFAQSTKANVIDYVLLHPESIGVLDYTEMSDSDAPQTREILNKIQLIAVTRPKDSIQNGYLKPYQYNLQDKMYPFTRELYFIGKTGMNDVSTGFIAFIAGDIGQKIILKAGLLPTFQSERWIELKSGTKPKVEK